MRLSPRRTFESVVDELADGLGSGTITLSACDEEPPLKDREELPKLQLSSALDVAFHRERVDRVTPKHNEKRELLEESHSVGQTAEPQFYEADRQLTAPASTSERHNIGKQLYIKGDIHGSGTLFIDGKLEGRVNLAGSRVIIGKNAEITADITARDLIINGKVRGDVSVTDRVDIRASGEISGDIAAARISIEDGAYFAGGIEIRKPDAFKIEDELHAELSAQERGEVHGFA